MLDTGVISASAGRGLLLLDDGYGEAACEQISRTLRRMGVRATFVINGIHLRGEPARFDRPDALRR